MSPQLVGEGRSVAWQGSAWPLFLIAGPHCLELKGVCADKVWRASKVLVVPHGVGGWVFWLVALLDLVSCQMAAAAAVDAAGAGAADAAGVDAVDAAVIDSAVVGAAVVDAGVVDAAGVDAADAAGVDAVLVA